MSNESHLRQVSILTTVEAEDLASVLVERETGGTPSTHTDAATGGSTVSVYLDLSDARAVEIRRSLRIALKEAAVEVPEIANAHVRIRAVRPQDWSESWKRHFRPLEIGRSLLILPTWSRKRPRAGQKVLRLDPGLSFGTGQHATTLFCLSQVVTLRTTESQSLLDLGCGSGILALAGAQLGYGPVAACDNDPDCIRIAGENAQKNGLESTVQPYLADVAELSFAPQRRFDVVCANLIHDLLTTERNRISAQVADGGHLVLAGILTTQFTAVTETYAEIGWNLVEQATGGEWTSGRFQRTS